MAADSSGDLLREAEAAIAGTGWDTARRHLAKVLDYGESAEALTALSKIAMIDRDYERAIELKERAFDLGKRSGQVESAVDNAIWLTFLYLAYQGNPRVAFGWKERASSMLEGVDECAAHGWLALLDAPFASTPAERERLALSALSIARRYADADLEAEALSLRGEALVSTGQVVQGMAMLDEAMAAVVSGAVRDHFARGEIYCRRGASAAPEDCESASSRGRNARPSSASNASGWTVDPPAPFGYQ